MRQRTCHGLSGNSFLDFWSKRAVQHAHPTGESFQPHSVLMDLRDPIFPRPPGKQRHGRQPLSNRACQHCLLSSRCVFLPHWAWKRLVACGGCCKDCCCCCCWLITVQLGQSLGLRLHCLQRLRHYHHDRGEVVGQRWLCRYIQRCLLVRWSVNFSCGLSARRAGKGLTAPYR